MLDGAHDFIPIKFAFLSVVKINETRPPALPRLPVAPAAPMDTVVRRTSRALQRNNEHEFAFIAPPEKSSVNYT